MNPDPLVYLGMPIHVSPLLPRIMPVRALKPRDWHKRGCYAKRVAKKWRKRFGVRVVNTMLICGGVAYVSKTEFEKLKQAIANRKPS